MSDLKGDAPNIVKSVLSMPNVANVNVEAIHAGAVHPSEFPMVPKNVLREHGAAMFLALAPNATPPNPRYTIEAIQFRCNDEAGIDFFGSDKPFWIFGSPGQGSAITTTPIVATPKPRKMLLNSAVRTGPSDSASS